MNRKKGVWYFLPYIVLAIVAICCLLPLLLIISASFMSDAGLTQYGYSFIPKDFSLEAYQYVFKQPVQLLISYGVTIFVTAFGTAVGLLFTSMMAYGISRKDYPLAKATTFFVYFTMLFPAALPAQYMMINNIMNLKNTIWVLILPLLVSAWHVMLMKGYFADIPVSMIEAGKIDGASESRIFFRLVLPVAKPGLATVGLFTMLLYWNDYKSSLLYITEDNLTSLQFLLYRMMSNIDFLKSALATQSGMLAGVKIPAESIRMAMCVVAAGPMLFIFPFFQKYFVKGISIGSVKE